MKVSKIDLIYSGFILIVSCILVFDLFLIPGRPASFDGIVHITNLAQFTHALLDGDFPITWLDGFGNYGMPIPLIAHQTTNYLGAVINIFLNNSVLSFNIVCFIGIFLSGIFYYIFLRLYLQSHYAFLATFLFTLAPYKILDIYIRADAPELFSMIFLPVILIGMYLWIKRIKIIGLFYISVSFCLLALTHPIMMVTYAFIYVPYFLFLVITSEKSILSKKNFIKIGFIGFAVISGIGMASYYLLPLNLEIKYFIQGTYKYFHSGGNYLSLSNYFDWRWYYYTPLDIFPRGHVMQGGLPEIAGLLFGLGIFIKRLTQGYYKENKVSILELFVVVAFIIAFFTFSYSDFFYVHIQVLDRIMFPWRMLSAFIFLPPIIIGLLLEKINSKFFIIILVILVCFLRFPQLYGKNYTIYPESSYYFTTENLYSNNLNTVWTEQTDNYPVHKLKGEIISGEGEIISKKVRNSTREYTVDAKTSVRMVDYTFFFPGWHVYVDGQERDILFQDPQYRGVITYTVPKGKHTILVRYKDTKIRLIGKLLSGFFLISLLSLFVIKKRIIKML